MTNQPTDITEITIFPQIQTARTEYKQMKSKTKTLNVASFYQQLSISAVRLQERTNPEVFMCVLQKYWSQQIRDDKRRRLTRYHINFLVKVNTNANKAISFISSSPGRFYPWLCTRLPDRIWVVCVLDSLTDVTFVLCLQCPLSKIINIKTLIYYTQDKDKSNV